MGEATEWAGKGWALGRVGRTGTGRRSQSSISWQISAKAGARRTALIICLRRE